MKVHQTTVDEYLQDIILESLHRKADAVGRAEIEQTAVKIDNLAANIAPESRLILEFELSSHIVSFLEQFTAWSEFIGGHGSLSRARRTPPPPPNAHYLNSAHDLQFQFSIFGIFAVPINSNTLVILTCFYLVFYNTPREKKTLAIKDVIRRRSCAKI